MALNGKVCVITGGGSGIGLAAARIMAAKGAKIVLVGRTESKLAEACGLIRSSGGSAEPHAGDVADRDAMRTLATAVMERFGKIDVLVNNAGHSSFHRKLLSTTPEEIQAVMNSNLVGTIYCSQAVVPHMLEAGEGTIINVASMAGVSPGMLGGMIYSAAKAAVINLTTFCNNEFVNSGLRFSVVIPGEVDTPILDNRPIPPSAEARKGMAGAEEVGEAIAMIAGLPPRTNIPELIIRPTYHRDASAETSRFE